MPILIVPFFALFGAILLDERADLTKKVSGQYEVMSRAELRARHSEMSLEVVPVDEKFYLLLRDAAKLHQKNIESIHDLKRLLYSAPNDEMKTKIEHLVDVMEHRVELSHHLIGSLRHMAITLGKESQRLIEQ